MALDLARPTAIPTSATSKNNHFSHHHAFQQPTPLSSASSTPDTISPTSTQADSVSPPAGQNLFPRRQIRAPKTPMYTPAVLRPTESPAYWRALEQGRSNIAAGLATKGANPTPPQSAGTSFDEGESRPSTDSRLNLGETDGKITRIVTDEWNESRMEDVTGSPTRSHWKPDSHSNKCESPVCPSTFSLVVRRHHCRRCGKIFCSQHSTHAVPLDQHATFHPRGELGRACDTCFADYKHWERMRKHRNDSTSGSESGSGTATPVYCGNKQKEDMDDKDKKTAFGSFCTRDWSSWSTF